MVSHSGSLCVAVLLILAGCSGTPAPEAGTTATPTTATTTATATAATTAKATSATTTTSSTARATRADLDAEDLSASERELLRRAVENGSVTVSRWNLSGRLTPETDGWEVRYRGTLYELSWRHEGIRGEYHLENASVVNASAVEASHGAISYENLTPEARELFDVARSGNDTDSYGAKAFPDQLREHGYVIYDGDYYELRMTVGDYVVYRLSVTEIGS